jgi:hypothetical protein
MAGKPKPHVFLSHVREDAARVERLAADLKARGIETWIDRHKIKPGQRWQKAIEDAIRSGAFFVACFSHAYSTRNRTYMNEELHIAVEEVRLRPAKTSWFIPVRLDDCEIPALPVSPNVTLRSFQWVDMFDWEEGVQRLAEEIAPPRPPEDLFERFSVFRDIDRPWCPEMVVLPPGEFMMGRPEGEEAYGNERPQHLVKINYWLAVGRYPITFDEYDHFTEAMERELPSDDGWGRGRRPVINITWHDAKAYVQWLEFQTDHPYRLLSEAEWEYACRAGTTTRYWWGDEITPEQANYGENIGRTSEVGTYPANSWGLYDMHGNVWEWVEDRWHDTYHGAPDDGSAWTTGSRSVVQRGGSWQHEPIHLRSASRTSESPRIPEAASGFRVARTL